MDKYVIWLKNHLKLVGMLVLTLIILIWQFWPTAKVNNNDVNFDQPKATKKLANKEATTKTSKWIIVDIEGAVNKPGVYRLLPTARVYDVIQHAGGVTEQADLQAINQAQKIHDQSQIFVPDKNNNAARVGSSGDVNSANSNAGIEKQVNLNTATIEQLQSLDGIGPKKAELIIKYRQEKGNFSKIEDLTNIQGIGEKTLEKIKSQITI
ncbi:MAG: helix-hairpin-helix domain-containing protein [Lactobacillus sp.]|uniref:helix-hairpin-helix domain-containing protein n=1 Tax=Bombilactobacillus bombi TaxID=1303590 RepID=UPI0015FDD738|nr:helix-hairpin-helix domain-containing protein [Bombilactobacillus bombi]MCO6541370.1 helix-hairpin-helix domain-containing protein [Lactobacillus sp.]